MSIPPPPFGSSPPSDVGSTPQPHGHLAPPPAPLSPYGPPPHERPPMPPGYQPYQQHGGGPMTFAGFWSRAGGILVDGLIGVAFAVPAFVAFFAVPKHRAACTVNGERGTCDVPNGGGWAVIISLALIAAAAYLVIYIGMVGRGQSWGMKAVGNKVVLADTGQPIGTGRSIGRFFARYLSGCVFYLGYFWMLWDPKKQTWHDKMVGSVVVKA